MLFAALCQFGTVTSSSIKVDNLVNLVRRMSLHEDEENQHGMKTILVEAEDFAPANRIDPANNTDGLNLDRAVRQDHSRKKRSRKLTEKGLCLKKSTLYNESKKMNSMLLTLASAIEDLMYAYRNMVTVEEENAQYDYIFKQLLLVLELIILCWTSKIRIMMMNDLKKLIKECLHSNT